MPINEISDFYMSHITPYAINKDTDQLVHPHSLISDWLSRLAKVMPVYILHGKC